MRIIIIILGFITCSNLFAQKINQIGQSSDVVLLYSKITFNLNASISFDDPFSQESIRMDAIIYKPGGDSLILPGFFLSGNSNESEWEVRFAARELGQYSARLIITNQFVKLKSELLTFSVIESDLDGFLSMAESNAFFQFDSGKKFRGIGTNFGWEAKDFEDQKFTYPFYFEKLAEENGNFARSWMAPHNIPLEWKDVDNHRYVDDTLRYNPSGTERLDEVFELANQYGIYLMLALDFHGELKTQPNYWGTGNFWSTNTYNIENGGPCSTPAEFFSNLDARRMYKDRLRYFIARWGYNTHLAVIEFWNEVDNAMADENIPSEDIVSWHIEMADYLQKMDPYHHIVSTSISHRHIEGLFNIENLDFAQAHIYSQTTNLAATIANLNSSYNKPGVVGEFGYDWTGAPSPVDELAYNNYFHLGLWRGLFSESPILPLTWWWEYFIDSGQLAELEKIKVFSDTIVKNSKSSISPAVVTGDSRAEKLALKSDSILFIWLRNQNTFGISDVTVNVNSYNLTGELNYRIYDCKKGTFSEEQKLNRAETESLITLEYLSAQKDIAIFFTPSKEPSLSSVLIERENKGVKVYPNPVSNYCTVSYWCDKTEKISCELITQDGMIVHKQKHQIIAGENKFDVSLNGLNKQICYIRLLSEERQIIKKIFIN